MYICIYVCMYVRMYVCMYGYPDMRCGQSITNRGKKLKYRGKTGSASKLATYWCGLWQNPDEIVMKDYKQSSNIQYV